MVSTGGLRTHVQIAVGITPRFLTGRGARPGHRVV